MPKKEPIDKSYFNHQTNKEYKGRLYNTGHLYWFEFRFKNERRQRTSIRMSKDEIVDFMDNNFPLLEIYTAMNSVKNPTGERALRFVRSKGGFQYLIVTVSRKTYQDINQMFRY